MAKNSIENKVLVLSTIVFITFLGIVLYGANQGWWQFELPWGNGDDGGGDTDTCLDSDGDNKYVTGITRGEDGITYTDRCHDGTTVYEYYCQNDGTWAGHTIVCSGGEICYQGKCSVDSNGNGIPDENEGITPPDPDDGDSDTITKITCSDVKLGLFGDLDQTCQDYGFCGLKYIQIGECHHYWDYNAGKHRCGCTDTFWCGQYCFEYLYTSGCECPPGSYQDWTSRSTYRCIPDGYDDCDKSGTPVIDEGEPQPPDCDSVCQIATGLTLDGGYYSGGVSCDDYWHYDSTSQCCCPTEMSYCKDLESNYDHCTTMDSIGGDCSWFILSSCGGDGSSATVDWCCCGYCY